MVSAYGVLVVFWGLLGLRLPCSCLGCQGRDVAELLRNWSPKKTNLKARPSLLCASECLGGGGGALVSDLALQSRREASDVQSGVLEGFGVADSGRICDNVAAAIIEGSPELGAPCVVHLHGLPRQFRQLIYSNTRRLKAGTMLNPRRRLKTRSRGITFTH